MSVLGFDLAVGQLDLPALVVQRKYLISRPARRLTRVGGQLRQQLLGQGVLAGAVRVHHRIHQQPGACLQQAGHANLGKGAFMLGVIALAAEDLAIPSGIDSKAAF